MIKTIRPQKSKSYTVSNYWFISLTDDFVIDLHRESKDLVLHEEKET